MNEHRISMINDNKFIRPTTFTTVVNNTRGPKSERPHCRASLSDFGPSQYFVCFAYFVASFRYAMRSARSLGFFSPANTIFVPGMYFFGFSRYSKRVSSFHVIPAKTSNLLIIEIKTNDVRLHNHLIYYRTDNLFIWHTFRFISF